MCLSGIQIEELVKNTEEIERELDGRKRGVGRACETGGGVVGGFAWEVETC